MSSTSASIGNSYDVLIVGGGPAGSTVATVLARQGLRVAVCERERFPRFHVGESLLPANLPLFERLGCAEAIRQAGFLVKPGASFFDEYEGRGGSTFTFEPTSFQPAFAYNVVRADFDHVLLKHAAQAGAAIYEQHTVRQPRVETDRVVVQVQDPEGTWHEVQAALLVDASGRSAVLGGSLGRREPLPDRGKVAFFAHFRGMRHDPDVPTGNIRIHLVRDGWIWWIPFADGVDSVGCVVHARVIKERGNSAERLFEEVLATSARLTAALRGAQRLTAVHSVANFSYRIVPPVGERYLAVGDATGFLDPIFSTGVFLGMRSGELAAEAIMQAFRQQDFRASAFLPYVTRLRQSVAPFAAMIRRFYEPAFLDLFFSSTPPIRLYHAVLWILSGAAFDRRPFWLRRRMAVFFTVARLRQGVRRLRGLPSASRWHW
ncbi:MAG: NAD(P)/FAD-dependent oxidoreductase [Candidatus Tectimicrobiota bacterium]